MLFIYGDSHAHSSFKGLTIPYEDRHEKSITMFRIGRDQQIIHYNPAEHDTNTIVCLAYGEVDCRCHIHRQRLLGREEDEVIKELVDTYLSIVCKILKDVRTVIILAVIPPTRQSDYEAINGPIQHEFPFIGSDEDRVRYTRKVNEALEWGCLERGRLWFINPYHSYERDDGTLRYELSDQTVHLGDTSAFLREFMEFYGGVKRV